MEQIEYQEVKYKYRLRKAYALKIDIVVPQRIGNDWVYLHADGMLTIAAGYCWDGPSGPALDTPDFMRASLVHDALYQLIEEAALPLVCRDYADKLMKQLCIEDGMPHLRAEYCYWAVKNFGEAYVLDGPAPILYAPKTKEQTREENLDRIPAGEYVSLLNDRLREQAIQNSAG